MDVGVLLLSSAYDVKNNNGWGNNLNGALALEKFETTDPLYPISDEWLKKNNLL